VRLTRVLRRIASSVVLATLVAGCGAVRFQRAWSGYEPAANVTALTPLEGRWRGEWRSAFNGHSGGLRCLLTSAEADPDRVRAWFYSTYARILFFQYQTDLAVTRAADGRLHFEGEQDLGDAVGGVYRYDGVVDGDRFHAHFRAENGDHGVFEMTRVD
jgi:hypothetical protein